MNRMMVGRDVDDCVWGLCFFFLFVFVAWREGSCVCTSRC